MRGTRRFDDRVPILAPAGLLLEYAPCAGERLDEDGGTYAGFTIALRATGRRLLDRRGGGRLHRSDHGRSTANANPQVAEAHHRVSRAGFKYLVTEQVCHAAGGPQRYTGRSMSDSHAHLRITEPEWQAFLDDLRQTFDRFNVPAAERGELLAIVESTKPEIVRGG